MTHLSGGICPRCNGFVPWGYFHICTGEYVPPTDNPPSTGDHLLRIAEALERIADILEPNLGRVINDPPTPPSYRPPERDIG